MSLLLKKERFFCLLAVIAIISCKKEYSYEGSGNNVFGNQPPVANAGPDQTIILPANTVNLNGSNSIDPDNNIAAYKWTQITGPSGSIIANTNAAKTGVSGLTEGTYQFELKVTDAGGLISKDTVTILLNRGEISVRWTRLTALPENEFLLGSNHINFLMGVQDKIFAVSKTGTFWSYDPQAKEWKKKGSIPSHTVNANFSVIFSINNKGYIIGNGTSRQYNATTDQWTIKTNVPVGADHVDYSVPLIIGSKTYLVASTNNLVTVYDPSTDTYTAKNKFPDISAAAGFVINDEGYCIQQDGRCWKYNVTTDTWQKKASLPSSIENMSGFVLNGYGYIMGDLNGNAYNGNGRIKLWRYDAMLDSWEQLNEDYPGQGVYAIKTASLNGIVYVAFGYEKNDQDAIDFWSLR